MSRQLAPSEPPKGVLRHRAVHVAACPAWRLLSLEIWHIRHPRDGHGPPHSPLPVPAGLDDAGLRLKCSTVAAALAANAAALAGGDPLAALSAVGGLELAAMAGAYLEAGRLGMPVLVDGFISGAAAVAAVRADPAAARVQFWSHASAERGAAAAAAAAGGAPALCMGLRLGEGTGAVLAVPLLRSAAALMRDMASLADVLAAEAAAAAQPAAGAAAAQAAAAERPGAAAGRANAAA